MNHIDVIDDIIQLQYEVVYDDGEVLKIGSVKNFETNAKFLPDYQNQLFIKQLKAWWTVELRRRKGESCE